MEVKQHASSHKNSTQRHEVETLTIAFLDALNRRDFTNPIWDRMIPNLEHTTQDFIGCTVGKRDRDDALTKYRDFCAANPNFKNEVRDSIVTQSRGENVATVFTVIRNSGMADGSESESTCTWTWERREGRWVCIRTTSMHGLSGVASEPLS